MLTLLTVALCGQYCVTAPRAYYPTNYVAKQAVAAPYHYQQSYADQILFVAVADPRYAGIVGEQERASKQATAVAQAASSELEKLKAGIAALQGQLASVAPAQAPQQPPQAGPPPPQYVLPTPVWHPANPEFDPTPPPPPDNTKSPVQVFGPKSPVKAGAQQSVLSVLQAKCAKCHTGPTAAKGYRMFEQDGSPVNLTTGQKVLAFFKVGWGEMPSEGELSPEDYSVIQNYLGEDKKAVAAFIKNCMEKR